MSKLDDIMIRIINLCSIGAPIHIIDGERRGFDKLHEELFGEDKEKYVTWDDI